jgi:CRP-like cAMP-binding protein
MSVTVREALHDLEQVDVFESLDRPALARLVQQAASRQFGPKEAIYSPGDANDQLLFVAEGKVKVHKVSNTGREFVLGILQAGDMFGLAHTTPSLNGNGPSEVYLTAVEAGRLYAIPRTAIEEAIRGCPEVALRMIEALDEQLQRFEAQIEDFAFRNVPTRVARLLARLGEEHGRVSREGVTIGLRLSHQDIANMIATSRETVSGVLGELREQGLIRTGGKMISILDYPGLQDVASRN